MIDDNNDDDVTCELSKMEDLFGFQISDFIFVIFIFIFLITIAHR